jgi:LPS-assembly protein
VVNLDYLTRRRDGVATRELANVSLTLPVGRHWRLYGGWRYDLVNARTQERFAGVGYESCCYAVRAVHRAYLSPADDGGLAELQSQFLIEFELRGLGGIGDRISDFIDDAVAGYRPLR